MDGTIATRGAVFVLIGLLCSGTALAVEARSGNENHAAANSTASSPAKDDSQIGLAGGGEAECPFDDHGPSASVDTEEYYDCIIEQLEAGDYEATQDGTILTITQDHSEPEGICYRETDGDIEWIELSYGAADYLPVLVMNAKIGKFGPATGITGKIEIEINCNDSDDECLEDNDELDEEENNKFPDITIDPVSPNSSPDTQVSGTLVSAGYGVAPRGNHLVVSDTDGNIWRISMVNTTATIRTMIALEQDGTSAILCPAP
jgi:hypothetical protein